MNRTSILESVKTARDWGFIFETTVKGATTRMNKHCFGKSEFGAVNVNGTTIIVVDNRVTTMKNMCDLLDVSQQDVIRFLSSENRSRMKLFPLSVKADQMLVEIRLLCLLGFAGAKKRAMAVPM